MARATSAAHGSTVYAIALGSNRRHGRYGAPSRVLDAALRRLKRKGVVPVAVSPTLTTPPLGPARRQFANAAALVRTDLDPPALLALLKRIERRFGRRSGGRWMDRVLDLDIVLWSEGVWHSPGLSIPHPLWRERNFVLAPLLTVAGDWRDPITGLRVRHLHARLQRTY